MTDPVQTSVKSGDAAAPKKRGRKPKQLGPSAASAKPLSESQRIIVLIAKATAQTTKLLKTESSENDGGYKFVSIDLYYEEVALKVSREFGLNWSLSEIPEYEQRFQDVYQDWHIRKVYRATIFSDVGDSFGAGTISVTMPYEGATTAGKMLSYADKAFMRQLFKIPTGEGEAEQAKTPARSEQGQQRDGAEKTRFFGKEGAEK